MRTDHDELEREDEDLEVEEREFAWNEDEEDPADRRKDPLRIP